MKLIITLILCINCYSSDIIRKEIDNKIYVSSDDFLVRCNTNYKCEEYNFSTYKWVPTNFKGFSKELQKIIK